MKLKNIKKRIKEYFDRKFYEEINSRSCWKKETLTEEDYRRLLYVIKYGSEIVKEYGSIENWERVMEINGFKPYMYHDIEDLKN